MRSSGQRRWERTGVVAGALGMMLLAPRARADASANVSVGVPDRVEAQRDKGSARVSITVFAEDERLDTFAERVKSWFHDATAVEVRTTPRGQSNSTPSAEAGVVTVWVIPLSAERALVTFSTEAPSGRERHLMRDVRLRDGLDELGLERLSSVIQSTVVALREGLEGADRETFESELRSAGVEGVVTPARSAAADSSENELAQNSTPGAEPSRAPRPIAVNESAQRSIRARATGPRFDVGYGARYAGDELVHGPSVVIGWPVFVANRALWVELRGGAFFPQTSGTPSFDVSLQTSTLRAGLAIEKRWLSKLSGYAAFVAGVDIVRIDSRLSGSANELSSRYQASASSTRLWGELGLVAGVWYRANVDVGLFGAVDYCSSDVSYVVATPRGDERVLSPWRWQPGMFVAARFGVTSRE